MPAVSISVLQGNRPKGIYLEVLAHGLMGLVGLKSRRQSGLGMQVAFHPTVFVGFFSYMYRMCFDHPQPLYPVLFLSHTSLWTLSSNKSTSHFHYDLLSSIRVCHWRKATLSHHSSHWFLSPLDSGGVFSVPPRPMPECNRLNLERVLCWWPWLLFTCECNTHVLSWRQHFPALLLILQLLQLLHPLPWCPSSEHCK